MSMMGTLFLLSQVAIMYPDLHYIAAWLTSFLPLSVTLWYHKTLPEQVKKITERSQKIIGVE
jgi:hypothetical protein